MPRSSHGRGAGRAGDTTAADDVIDEALSECRMLQLKKLLQTAKQRRATFALPAE